MRRLIDADRLRKDILNLQDCYNGFSDTYDKACIIGVIDEQPTIDPVKHGEWEMLMGWPFPEWRCTRCGNIICGDVEHLEKWKYCHQCGTKMDGLIRKDGEENG